MGFEISELEVRGYWQVKYHGKVTSAIRAQALKEGLELSQGKELYGAFVDFSEATLEMSITDLYGFAEARERSGRFFSVREAYLHKADDLEKEEFQVLVSQNRGLFSEVFSDKAEALKWLIKDEHRKR